jgi:hypothetical protein
MREAHIPADMSASFVVGFAIRSAPEWMICAARDRPRRRTRWPAWCDDLAMGSAVDVEIM